MTNVPKRREPDRGEPSQSLALARAVLIAGGGFSTTIATILGVAGKWQVGDVATLWALGTLSIVAAMTMFSVAYLMRHHR